MPTIAGFGCFTKRTCRPHALSPSPKEVTGVVPIPQKGDALAEMEFVVLYKSNFAFPTIVGAAVLGNNG